MAKATVYNLQGKKIKDVELDPQIFGVAVKPEVIQQAVVIQQANSREVIGSTKDKSEVSGGGRKPWRQKGTGRARHGSSRSPIWRGGGITFGPTTERNFSLKINKKAKRKALLMSLSDKAAHEKIMLLENFDGNDGKTKTVFSFLKNVNMRGKKSVEKENGEKKQKYIANSVLMVLPKSDDAAVRAFRNIPRVQTIAADSLNIVDVVKHQYVIIAQDAIDTIKKTFVR